MKGKFVLVVGTSGSGKGTLMGHVRPLVADVVAFAKSCTTRAMRAGESEGNPYFFLTVDAFKGKIDAGEFLEWAEYGGNFYGTLKSELEPLSEGMIVVKEMEVQGARQVLEKLPREQLMIIFINAGSWEEMEARIKGRAPMPEEELKKRKERYQDEMSFMNDADIVVENKTGKVEEAKKDFEEAIRSIVEASE